MKNPVYLILHILVLVASCVTAHANLLPAFEPVIVSAGDIVEHVIDIQDEAREGVRVEIKLISKPEGARIIVNDDGQMILTWKTSPDLDDETELVIRARNVDTGDIIQTQELLVRKVLVLEENDSPASVVIEPVLQAGNPVPDVDADASEESFETANLQELPRSEPAVQPEIEDGEPEVIDQEDELAMSTRSEGSEAQDTRAHVQPDTPTQDTTDVDFGLVSNQIISVGRTVSMRFDASSSDGEDPVLTIDRLPANASFEKNINGSYTLFWQTGDRDQGEHVFKLTARHPLDNSISESIYWTLVVGDPSMGKSVPEDFDG